MKTLHLFITGLSFAVCQIVSGQVKDRSWELSLSGNLGSISGSSEVSSTYGSSKSDMDAQGFVSLAFRPGYWIAGGFEVEPEILWTAIEKDPPVFSVSGNVSYNVPIPGQQVVPFILAGYGIGNGIPVFERLFSRSSDGLDVKLLNFGAGLKILVSERVALRTEYRYQSYSLETSETFYGGNYTAKLTRNYHNLFLGFSVFVP